MRSEYSKFAQLLFIPMLSAGVSVEAATSEKFVPLDYSQPNVCSDFYEFEKVGGTCKGFPEKVDKPSEARCNGFDFSFDKSSGKCSSAGATKIPACKPMVGFLPSISGTGAEAKCSYERLVVRSAPGDYIGDCIEIKVKPAGTDIDVGKYLVTAQKEIEGDDRELTLVPGEVQVFPGVHCASLSGSPKKVNASQLIDLGAIRQGYTYGFLTMPYKYYPGQKSFQLGIPVGGYLGWRYGQAGSATTAAAALTLGTVKANTVDPNKLDGSGKPSVLGSSDVPVISLALGVMFDILKSSRGKPFKAGVFVGADVVNNDPTIEYRFNRKKWVAIQLGYEFTDN
jgi:hypothetical protein